MHTQNHVHKIKTRLIISITFLLTAVAAVNISAGPFIVENGESNARIVTTDNPPRMTKIAARELQRYIEKISGAKLPIVRESEEKSAVAHRKSGNVVIYVGDSRGAAAAGVTSEGLDYGAYRMVSGENWLALVGNDENFEPTEPWARSRSQWQRTKSREWDKLAGGMWRNPIAAGMRKGYTGNARDYGKPESEKERNTEDPIHFWAGDKRGSPNAVYAFLRSLGVRWYMPGEHGEILPKQRSIALPDVDKTVVPDIRVRSMSWDRYRAITREQLLWSLRLGLSNISGLMHHGLRYVTERQDQRQAHPEYMQLVNGRRTLKNSSANACLSSPELFKQNVAFVRTIFDLYDAQVVSVMPHDGFIHFCECPLCNGKDRPDRGSRGRFSDYVWNYVCRVAEAVAETHPEKRIICGAYSTYQDPPESIDKLPSNVLVGITNGRPRTTLDPAFHKQLSELREQWLQKSSSKLSISINYHFGYVPFYTPHIIAKGLRAEKGQVWREDCWFHPFTRQGLYKPGVTHLSVYTMARLWWDQDLDIDDLLTEYYRLYYGPVRKEMKAFIAYCEQNYEALTKDKEKVTRALALFEAVKENVPEGTVYAQRIAPVDDYLADMRKRKEQLVKGRQNVPVFHRTINFDKDKWQKERETLRLDGRLDEPFWQTYPHGADFKELRTGRDSAFTTNFLARWYDNNLYFGIRCEDKAGNPVNISATKDGDEKIWQGDCLEIHLETDEHSYYQIVLNPAGAVVDLDRGARKRNWFKWSSEADVATHIGKDYWSVEVRIPVTQSTDDPLHQVIGHAPTESMPWYFNILRKRARGGKAELSAYSPTGKRDFHVVNKFAKLYLR